MTVRSDKKLLDGFEPATYEQWREAAEKLLKGAPFEKLMLSKTPEGITLQPIYFREAIEGLPSAEAQPGGGNFARGGRASGYASKPWSIAQEQPYGDPQAYNKALIKDLNAGQSAVNLLLDAAGQLGLDPDEAEDDQVAICGTSIARLDDLELALDGVHLDYLPLYFQSGCSGMAIEAMLLAIIKQRGVAPETVSGGLGMDPLAVLAGRGRLPAKLEMLWDELSLLVQYNAEKAPKFRAAALSGMPHHCAGASAAEELAALLSSGVLYLKAMDARGVGVDEAASQLQFTLSIGGDFFMEVAKLRAARVLWSRIVKELGGGAAAQRMFQVVRTGLFNKTKLDPYVNMLRSTTEAFSAAVGGADSICVGTFDEAIQSPNDFSRRVARNLQVILQEECELSAVVDPGGGSWYIESLTRELGRKSWELFQTLEKEGGIEEALLKGSWQERLATTRKNRETLLGQRRSSLIGVNQYANLQETPLQNGKATDPAAAREHARYMAKNQQASVELGALRNGYVKAEPDQRIPFLVDAVEQGASLGGVSHIVRGDAGESVEIEPLPYNRLSMMYEALRAAADRYKERHGAAPQIFLANLGPLKRHKIRADFTRSFFAAGGFECIYSKGFEEDSDAVAALKDSGAQIAVICGMDDDYVERAPGLAQAIKAALPDTKLLLAGHPGDNEEAFRDAGLDDYIFIKSNNYEVNRAYLKTLGALD